MGEAWHRLFMKAVDLLFALAACVVIIRGAW
jgi:hypothetical protein